jgi:hypothetical protein
MINPRTLGHELLTRPTPQEIVEKFRKREITLSQTVRIISSAKQRMEGISQKAASHDFIRLICYCQSSEYGDDSELICGSDGGKINALIIGVW